MKDEDIKLPKMPCLVNSQSWHDDIQEYARQAVRMNMPQPKPSDPEPFDLARAMAGEPIVTRDGRKARFVGYVPEFSPERQIAVAIDGASGFNEYYKDGRYFSGAGPNDLFMAPKPKRTVWVNVWPRSDGSIGVTCPAYETKEMAERRASECGNLIHIVIAHPIEIDTTE